MFSKKVKYFIPIIVLLLLVGLGGVPDSVDASDIGSAVNSVHPDLRDKLDEDGLVEALVILKERADTAGLDETVRQYARHFAVKEEHIKTLTRRAVVSTLKDTAAKTQNPLMDLLEKEMDRGRFGKVKNYFIVNAIYLKAEPVVIKVLSQKPAVDKIVPNDTFELHTGGEGWGTSVPASVQLSSDNVEWNIKQIKAHRVWEEYGLDGEGVVVGVMDTGANWEHEALKEKWRGYCPDGNHEPEYSWYDAVDGEEMPVDVNSGYHGTHVVGTVVGADPEDENIIGVAPGAQWIAANAFENDSASLNDLIAAGEYLLAPGGNPDMAPDIINNSWGAPTSGDQSSDEWFRDMVQSWRDAIIFPVFAAGNYESGSAPEGSIIIPAIYPESIAVAATDSSDERAGFSCRGPVEYYPYEIKPNISAPGVGIRSCTSGTSSYQSKNGTSMAAPHIAGAAALLLSYDPDLGLEELEKTLYTTAIPLTDLDYDSLPNHGYGYGLVNVLAAVDSLDYDLTIEDSNLEEVIRQELNKISKEDYLEYVITRVDMEQIENLEANEKEIVSLNGLEYAENLETLNLNDNQISNISSLSGLSGLQELWLNDNQLSEIWALSDLENLHGLGLINNQIEDISPLYELNNLRGLGLSENEISDISSLSGLSNLSEIWLHNNHISDVSPLSELSNLERLSLSGNNISNISPLSGLNNLALLNLHDNQISEIEALSDLSNLEGLGLNDNQIEDITPLSGLNNLGMLWLHYNEISDVSPLSYLDNLQDLKLQYNYLDTDEGSSAMEIINELKDEGVDVEYLPQKDIYTPRRGGAGEPLADIIRSFLEFIFYLFK